MRVIVRPRRLKPTKVELVDESNKVAVVIDQQEAREVNPVPEQERFKFDAVIDNFVTCEDLFKCGYESLEKLHFYLPKEFLANLNELSLAAHKSGLPFEPYTKMLRALYREAERLRVQLHYKGVEAPGILKYKEAFKVEEEEKKQALAQSDEAKIIKKFSTLRGDYFKRFNEIAAERYGKAKHSVQEKHLLGYAEGFGEPSNWVCAVALEVLHEHRINIFDLGVSKERIKEIWLKSNKQESEATFLKTFSK